MALPSLRDRRRSIYIVWVKSRDNSQPQEAKTVRGNYVLTVIPSAIKIPFDPSTRYADSEDTQPIRRNIMAKANMSDSGISSAKIMQPHLALLVPIKDRKKTGRKNLGYPA